MGWSRLINQLELGCEAVGAGVLEEAPHRVGVEVADELTDPSSAARQHRFQAVQGLRASASRLKENEPEKRGGKDPPTLIRVPRHPTWSSEDDVEWLELLVSSFRAFMASLAAICLATFLLGALAVGKVWVPTVTQYWNLGVVRGDGPKGWVGIATSTQSTWPRSHSLHSSLFSCPVSEPG